MSDLNNPELPDDEALANARLIAAAPLLLAACEAFLRAPTVCGGGNGSVTIEVQTYNLDAARAAIAAARGEKERS